jgi:Transcriptional regulators
LFSGSTLQSKRPSSASFITGNATVWTLESFLASVFARIHSFLHSLTPSEAKVADYCLSHPDSIINCAINEVAQQSGVSVASVSRLAVTLGYRDWKELRLSLAKDSSMAEANPVFPDIMPEDSDEMVARKVFEGNILSLRDTLDQVDFKDLQRVVRAVQKTERVVFFGSGGSGCIARDESIRFAHLEMGAEAYFEEFQMMLIAARMKRGQVAFGFSNSGRSRATVGVMREARKNRALTIGIANYRNTPLEEVSDIFFCTSFPRRGGFTSSLTARIAVMGIMDAIYVLVAHHGRMASNVKEVDRALESVRLSVKSTNG